LYAEIKKKDVCPKGVITAKEQNVWLGTYAYGFNVHYLLL
jgi:hypothetical protein